MTRLEELSQRYHTHPDEGGDYLTLDELNELCSLQNDEIERLELALRAIAIYWQDEKPQRDDRDSLFDWRACSIRQEDIARDTLKGQWPPKATPTQEQPA